MKQPLYVSPETLILELQVEQVILSSSQETDREQFTWSDDDSIFN